MVSREPHEILDRVQPYPNREPGAQPDQSQRPTPNPFLPETKIQFAWDSTSLGAFKKCARYYQYKIIEGWRKPEDPIHLRWGQELHSALEDYDRSLAIGVKHDDAVHDSVRALMERISSWDPKPKTKSEEFKTKANLLRTVVWYLEHYNPDPAETFILANGKPAVELSFNFELEWGPIKGKLSPIDATTGKFDITKAPTNQPYLLCGHLDKVVSFGGDLYVMDHKTSSSQPSAYYFNQFEPNNQMTLYTLASQTIMKSPIRGVILDVIQVGAGFSRFTRGFTYRTPDQLEEWLVNLKRWLRDAETCAEEDFWPMNDTACDKFGGCEFREICSKSPGVRERFLESNFERKELWNPLKPR